MDNKKETAPGGEGQEQASKKVSKSVFPRGTDSARVVTVIETKAARGDGSSEDQSCRIVTQYWSMNGELLAESDPIS